MRDEPSTCDGPDLCSSPPVRDIDCIVRFKHTKYLFAILEVTKCALSCYRCSRDQYTLVNILDPSDTRDYCCNSIVEGGGSP